MNKKVRRMRRGAKAKAIQSRDLLKPRLVVFKSAAHIYSQIVVRSELGDTVLASASTVDNELKPQLTGTKSNRAAQVGSLLGKRAKEKNVVDISFDRCGYKYHGCIKALADGAREAGLNF